MNIKLQIVEETNSLVVTYSYEELMGQAPSPEVNGDILSLLYTIIGKACDVEEEELENNVYDDKTHKCYTFCVSFPEKYLSDITDFVDNNHGVLLQYADMMV